MLSRRRILATSWHLGWGATLALGYQVLGNQTQDLKLLANQPDPNAELKIIQERGYVIVAVKDNRPPLGFRDPSGQLVGLEIDLAKQLAQDLLGRAEAIRFVPVTNGDRLALLLNGQVDWVIAGVSQTATRSRVVSFSPPYYLDGTTLVTQDRTIKNIDQLSQKAIAVLQSSDAIGVVRSLLPKAKLVPVPSYQQAHTLLEAGQAAAFAGDLTVLSAWVKQYPQYHLLPEQLSIAPLCVVMPKGLQYDTLRHQVNRAIEQGQASGWLRQRITYWGLP